MNFSRPAAQTSVDASILLVTVVENLPVTIVNSLIPPCNKFLFPSSYLLDILFNFPLVVESEEGVGANISSY